VNIARIILGVAFAAAIPAHAASVSYFLDQSNALPDGSNYLQVTLTEADGGVDFRVQTLAPLNDVAGGNFGIQEFGFNFASDSSWEIEGLPRGWWDQENKQMSEFGRYDVRLKGTGSSRTDDLGFTVAGTDLSDFDTFFAAHVAGFEWCLDGDGESSDKWSGGKPCREGKDCITSAFFGGNDPVPLPASVWLLFSSMVGFGAVIRRRRNNMTAD
jgi:hypothetical protein